MVRVRVVDGSYLAYLLARAEETENCQSFHSFLAAFTKFTKSFLAAFTVFGISLFFIFTVKEFRYCNFQMQMLLYYKHNECQTNIAYTCLTNMPISIMIINSNAAKCYQTCTI